MLTVYAAWAETQMFCEKEATTPLPEKVNKITWSQRTVVSDREFNCYFIVWFWGNGYTICFLIKVTYFCTHRCGFLCMCAWVWFCSVNIRCVHAYRRMLKDSILRRMFKYHIRHSNVCELKYVYFSYSFGFQWDIFLLIWLYLREVWNGVSVVTVFLLN